MEILIIEDKVAIVSQVVRLIERYCGRKVVFAATIETAKELFLEHKDTLKIIYLDGRLQSLDEWDTKGLMDLFKEEGFQGSVISISDNTLVERQMLDHGCSGSCQKMEIPTHATMFFGTNKNKVTT
ncbi:MAG: hypothetical protein WCO18_02715 [bacterium]